MNRETALPVPGAFLLPPPDPFYFLVDIESQNSLSLLTAV
jgi:hypothetical protein